jgi:hypothetical protein
MTKELYLLSDAQNKRSVNSFEFLEEINNTLKELLAQ